ncbi:hypothetical protein OX284_005080 [Flavobacterium sp. SUN046]|uniref:hypothetical protein n=1 Tax=Flavobacterium sp. SUN046 TaxID=3002440 RepID=UPI002DC0475D|nr:hypothetical protein [Flavobacterium sp. SUN046]MEC4048794.1 hypothetical protein [Flavobacterium sp. SUN046]
MATLNNPLTGNGKSTSKGNIPSADVDLVMVATEVAAKWAIKPEIVLVWITVVEFAAKTGQLKTVFESRTLVGSERPQITEQLKTLDRKINKHLRYVKNYIEEKFKDAALSYYPSFGIVYQSKSYILPKDRNSRSEALNLMVNALTENNLDEKEFGTDFWTAIRTEYNLLIGRAVTNDGQVAIKVGSMAALKKEIRLTLNCLINAIKANYPVSYKAELRDWGFQREKY